MVQGRTKKGRLRLDPASYRRVWLKVLTRDGWRCQICGCTANLQVHHITRRSSCGNDEEENLIALCVSCHQAVHRQQPMSGQPNMVPQGLQAIILSLSWSVSARRIDFSSRMAGSSKTK